MRKRYSDDFAIVRHYVYWYFVSSSAKIHREDLDVEDVVNIIRAVGNDYIAENKAGFVEIPKFKRLRGTQDRDLRALATKFLYFLLNLWPLRCRKDYYCKWVYPYGFVPEAGCPYHD